MPRGFWQGLERSTGRAVTAVPNTLIAAQGLQLRRDVAESDMATQRLKQEEIQRRLDFLKKPFNITTTPHYLAAPPELQKTVLKFGAANGYWDATGQGTVESAMQGGKAILLSKELYGGAAEVRIQQKQLAMENAFESWQKAKDSGDDPEKVKKLGEKFLRTRNSLELTKGNASKWMHELDKIEAAKKPTVPKITHIDRGDKVDIYTDGVFTKSVKKGAAPVKPVSLATALDKQCPGYRFTKSGPS